MCWCMMILLRKGDSVKVHAGKTESDRSIDLDSRAMLGSISSPRPSPGLQLAFPSPGYCVHVKEGQVGAVVLKVQEMR